MSTLTNRKELSFCLRDSQKLLSPSAPASMRRLLQHIIRLQSSPDSQEPESFTSSVSRLVEVGFFLQISPDIY
jgi:hypothetical protein